MDPLAKSVWASSNINIYPNYKAGRTGIIIFGNTARRVLKQGYNEMGQWSWTALEGTDKKVIFFISIFQCCKNITKVHGTTVYHQKETMVSEKNKLDGYSRRNFYHDLCKFLRHFFWIMEREVKPLLLGYWNEEDTGTSISKKLCDKFSLVNIFHRKYPNYKKFKTYQ